MQVITVNSEKGGTGKTTVATHTAALQAAMGKQVLFVDFDPQGNGTMSFGLQPEPGLYEMLVRDADIFDWLREPSADRYCPPGMEPKGRLLVLPGNRETHGITSAVDDRDLFAEKLEDLEGVIDVVVIDTAPSPGMLLALAYRATDWLLIPSQMEYLSLSGVLATIRTAERAGIKLMGIQPNMYRDATTLHTHHYQMLCEEAAKPENQWPIWEPIPLSIVWAEASALRQMVYSLEGNVGHARRQALALAERVERALR